MEKNDREQACSDPTQEFILEIPCVLANRAQSYASEHDTTITNVVIEALDFFLRKRTGRQV
jgi:hypothetical protein